jgi:hypothetical protein
MKTFSLGKKIKVLVIVFSVLINWTTFFEFQLLPCYNFIESDFAMHLDPTLKLSKRV